MMRNQKKKHMGYNASLFFLFCFIIVVSRYLDDHKKKIIIEVNVGTLNISGVWFHQAKPQLLFVICRFTILSFMIRRNIFYHKSLPTKSISPFEIHFLTMNYKSIYRSVKNLIKKQHFVSNNLRSRR